jgi:hypothetical protein
MLAKASNVASMPKRMFESCDWSPEFIPLLSNAGEKAIVELAIADEARTRSPCGGREICE